MSDKNLQIIDERKVLGKDFKIYGDIENPLFLAKDVAEWIDYAKTGKGAFDVSKMLNTVDDNEKLNGIIFVSGQNREMKFLTEDGLYEVLMQSRKPIAKQFKKEVKQILKTIRLNGMYATDKLLDNPDLVIKAFTKLKEEREKNKKLEDKIKEDKPRVGFAKTIEKANKCILVREFSKILANEGIKLGEKKLYQWLRKNKYILKHSTEPMQSAVQQGLFKVHKKIIYRYGGCMISTTTRITGKGQVYFLNKLKKEFLNK